MLRLENIKKSYLSGTNSVYALNDVSLSFRKNEFVSILGPSGSGKTTLLNIIGGLDKYTEGDLIIVGKSTKDFKDRDWDIYRNQRIGFIFQSYNLIPHQNILRNVELALTISGVSKVERKQRALKALEDVGLKGQEHKKPNQLSGGQCQRVAIARALVNNPEILLADEPTGALDTKTSEQIMDLIKNIAKKKLVIMVTHNPDIAEKYSTRIINLLDGKIVADSDPFNKRDEINEISKLDETEINKHSLAKMNWRTAIGLSTKNLISKLKRTSLVSIAGSIGIIGVSAVLAVSNGISNYITSMQDDMLSSYPLTIEEQSVDYTSLMNGLSDSEKLEAIEFEDGEIGIDSMINYLMTKYTDFTSVKTNDINHDLLKFISEMPSEGQAAIAYNYGIDVTNNIFTNWKRNDSSAEEMVSLNGLTQLYIAELKDVEGFDEYTQFVDLFTAFMKVLPGGKDYILGDRNNHGQYDLIEGTFATEENEIMIVINEKETLTDLLFAQLGFFTEEEFLNLAKEAVEKNKENPDQSLLDSYKNYPKSFSFEDLIGKEFVYYPHDKIYSYQTVGTGWNEQFGISYPISGYSYPAFKQDSWGEGLKMKISGILKPNENTNFGCLSRGVYYTQKFADKYISDAKNSKILTDEINGFYSHIGSLKEKNMPYLAYVTFPYTSYKDPENPVIKDSYASCLNADFSNSLSSMFSSFSGGIDYFELDKIYLRAISGQSIKQRTSAADFEGFVLLERDNESGISYYDIDTLPSHISIYPQSFDAKDIATDYLNQWNSNNDIQFHDGTILEAENREELTYGDTIEMIVDVINTLITIITAALISFTSLALVVSCFMIAVITYISVVERVKEIGVIRSLGGRKKDVRRLFVAETFVIGFTSGIIGVGFTYVLCIILNLILKIKGIPAIGKLNPIHAVIMVALSFALTVLSGLIPSGNASKQNPVDALRSE